ncbi:MAG: hypothetical protein JO314_12160, partial [Acidobacteria bacterium]|nr:hypothetical protein [Acidobacteriota bacterium]
MTNEEHNKYISWAFLAHSGFQLVMLLFIAAMFAVMMFSIEPPPGQPPFPKAMFGVMIGFMTFIQLIFTIPSIVAAYALRKKKPWARMAAIIGGVMAAMHVPFGTAACVYSLWFFMGDNWKEIYPEQAGSQPVQQLPEFNHAKWEGGFTTDEQGRAVFTKVE